MSDSAISHQAVNRQWPALQVTSGGDISLHEELGRSRQRQCHGLQSGKQQVPQKVTKGTFMALGTLWHFMDVEPPNSPGGWAIAPYNQQSPRSSVAIICGNGREERNVYNPRMVEKCRKSTSPDFNDFIQFDSSHQDLSSTNPIITSSGQDGPLPRNFRLPTCGKVSART